MKLLVSLIFSLLLYANPANAFLWNTMICGGEAGGGCDTESSTYTSGSALLNIANFAGQLYAGLEWTGTTISDVCAVTFWLQRVGSTGNSYVAKAYSMTGDDLLTVQATSATVADTSIPTTLTEIEFTFSTSFDLTSDMALVVTTSDASTDSANYMKMGYNSAGVSTDTSGGNWRDTLVANGLAEAKDVKHRINTP